MFDGRRPPPSGALTTAVYQLAAKKGEGTAVMSTVLIDEDLLAEAIDGRERMFAKLRKLSRLVNNETLYGVEATEEEIEDLQATVADLACAIADHFDLEQDLVRECIKAGERAALKRSDT